MAQINISHFTDISVEENRHFSELVRDVAAWEVHAVKKTDIEPDTVSVMVFPVDMAASISGAETEVQVLVSGNDWPRNSDGTPADAAVAKKHFDQMAGNIYKALTTNSNRKIYIWVTPFMTTGWAE